MAQGPNTLKTHYITTAIVYPNSRIHVGWAWECLGADWLVRATKAQGEPTYFVTGMDEHALKVQKAAEAQGLTPQAYCDKMADDVTQVLQQMGISYDRFIRTSDEDHVRVVQALVQRAFDKGDIYSGKYEGYYCEGCEAYYTEKDLTPDGLCIAHKKAPKWISEENFFFKLSKYQKPLLELFAKQPDFLQPEYRRGEVVNFIEAGLKDFSISRSTFTWGVPLPFDPKHVVYVWFDALLNYLTAAGYESKIPGHTAKAGSPDFDKTWPADLHVIGKDISRFHCIYWPAMLMSLDIPLPKHVFAHGFITLKGERLSKSSGNTVSPDEVMAWSGPDPFRYYLLAENQFSQDGNFSLDALLHKANADLANDWGNLVNRSISMTLKYFPNQEIAPPDESSLMPESKEVVESFARLRSELQATMKNVDPSAYASTCTARSRLLNLYIDKLKPWSLAKEDTETSRRKLSETLYCLLEGIRWIATTLMPVLPFGMPQVFAQLGRETPPELGAQRDLVWGKLPYRVNPPKPIYPRLEMPVPPAEVPA